MNAGRRTEPGAGRLALYSSRVLCRDRRRAQTYALSLNDDHGGAAETGGASAPRSGKPEGFPALPLEPRVQGRLARIDMVEHVFSCAGMHQRTLPVDGSRSEEHTSELQSLMSTSYAVFCLKTQNHTLTTTQVQPN